MGCCSSTDEKGFNLTREQRSAIENTYSFLCSRGPSKNGDAFKESTFIKLFQPLEALPRQIYQTLRKKSNSGKIGPNEFLKFAELLTNKDRFESIRNNSNKKLSKIGILASFYFNNGSNSKKHEIEVSKISANTFLSVKSF